MGLVGESDSNASGSALSNRAFDSHREMLDRDNQGYDDVQHFENESNKSDQIDDAIMNVFGFNDDLNLDDRIIVSNPTDNQNYNLVERPKYLLSFELKDSE